MNIYYFSLINSYYVVYNLFIQERGGVMKDWNTKKKTTIGGQALIEGIMMRGTEDIAIAVRKPDSTISVDKRKAVSYTKKNKFLGLPLIRGSVALIESMVIGIKALTYSAEFYEDEEDNEEMGKFEKFLTKVFGEKLESVAMGFSVVVSLGIGIALFFVLPVILTGFIKSITESAVLRNLVEGIIRIAIFVFYIFLISRMNDIKRVFQYHGAEHKSIYCYENEEELTVENARKYPRLHPRCGTNFLFIVMIISIFVFSFVKTQNMGTKILSRVVLLPLVAGISYEVLRFVGRSDSKIVRILIYPGLALQYLTTREPDDDQIEVALEALNSVLVEDKEADVW